MRPEPPSPATIKRRAATDGDTRTYRFLTYVMGGGVQVKEHLKLPDDVTPVRAASIRGQLRFWWRACNPSGCTTIDELRQREGKIWGATSQTSQVVVEVLDQPGVPMPVKVYRDNNHGRFGLAPGMKAIAYGAFPLQPKREAQEHGARPGVLYDYGSKNFKVRFSYPKELRSDVEAALWAWETFGGLGARTRRGFGAVSRVDERPASPSQIEGALAAYRVSIPDVPSLAGARLVMAPRVVPDALLAWKHVLSVLQNLRQGENLGRNEGRGDRPARSRWPEPDELRRITSSTAPRHREPVVSVQRFPRARFGLPIVFHFVGGEGDPEFTPFQVHPRDHDRFPSPLILRPLADGAQFRAAALALTVDTPSDLVLTYGTSTADVQWQLDESLAARIPVMNDRTARPSVFTDPIDRFLWELKK